MLHSLGKWAEAEAYLQQALFVQREIGDRQGELLSLNNLGWLLTQAGRVPEALEHLDHAIRYVKAGEFTPELRCQIHINLALAHLQQGQTPAAVADLQVCLETTEDGDNRDLRVLTEAYLAGTHASREVRAELLSVNVHLLRATGDLPSAKNACLAALEIYEELGSRYETAQLQVEAAEVLLALGEAPDKGSVRKALRTFQALPARADIARAEGVLLQLGATGDLAWPAVVVQLSLDMKGSEEEDWHTQEALVIARGRLLRELRQSGRAASALVTQTGADISYVLSSPEQDVRADLVPRSVQCAQQALETLKHLNHSLQREHGQEAALRIGIEVGSWPGPSAEPAHVAIFTSSSRVGRQAAALAAAAAPNSISLSAEAAAPLKETYHLKAIDTDGDRRLPAVVYRLGRARAGHHVPIGFPGTSQHLIGRQTEREQLEAWLEGQNGKICYQEAEAGMGKTRLVEHLTAQAQPDLHVMIGKCESFKNAVSYAPLVDMLSGAGGPDTPTHRQLECILGLPPPPAQMSARCSN